MRSFSISSEDTFGECEIEPSGLHVSSSVSFTKVNIPNRSPVGRRLGLSSGGIFTPHRKNLEKPDPRTHSKKERIRTYTKRLLRRKNLERTFPILKWGLNYDLNKLLHDIISGVTVTLVIIPQALAYAVVAGLPPTMGLYSSFVGPFVYIIFGTTSSITVGPSAILSIATYKYTSSKSPEYAVFLCFSTAVFTLILGIFRLGFISNFISAPVISAFTSATALTIIATQLKPMLGLSFPGEEFLENLLGIFEHWKNIKSEDALLGFVCCVILLLMMYLQKIFRCVTINWPRMEKFLWFMSIAKSALVMLGSTILVACWYPDQPFSIMGHISPGLPEFKPPPFEIYSPRDNRTHSFNDILKEEASAIFIVPLLGIICHVTLAKVFSGTERVDSSQEILVLGISNAISCFFSSMPIGGSFSRTTVNVQSGVKTPAGGLITSILVILALKYLTPFFFYIPKASIAGVICISCLFMVNPYILLPLWRSKKMDLIPWTLTFLMTLLTGLEYGIATGILISATFLLYYSARPRIRTGTRQTPKGTTYNLILLDRSLTFPSVDYISNQIIKAASNWGSVDTPIVIDCHHIQFSDYSAAEGMRDLIANMNNLGYQVFFWKVKPSVFRVISGTMRSSDLPLFRCNTEGELNAVLDGVDKRLSMFHPFVIKDGNKLPTTSRKQSETSSVRGKTAASAVSTGVFI